MADTCFVCGSKMNDYFVKHEYYPAFGKNIDRKFVRCENCGLVIDQTSYEMSPEERSLINDTTVLQVYERAIQTGVKDSRRTDRLERQSVFVYQTLRTGIIPNNARIVDYGCATGELVQRVNQLREAHSDMFSKVYPYDRYYNGGDTSLMMK